MERVLKRVGLSKRAQTDAKIQNANAGETGTKLRRRKRSKTRRRAAGNETKKTRGLFNIDWESVKECKSCKSRAITRRFCSKRCDNELYRSNSFKFERFVRGSDENSTLGKKIALCDDYSLPVDHLNKKRPNSIAVPSFSDFNAASSPLEENVQILETYSTPRDSKQKLTQDDVDLKCFTSPDREYSQPYTTEDSSEVSSDDEFFGHHITITKPLELNSPDSIAEAILPLNVQSPDRSDVKRHPSPYYYADLYKNKTEAIHKRSQNYENSDPESEQPPKPAYKNKNQKRKSSYRKCHKSSSLDNSNLDKSTIRARQCQSQLQYKKSFSVDSPSVRPRNASKEPDRLTTPRICLTPNDDLDDEMTRQRHVYETAFDCRIDKSDDDLDQLNKVANHPVLFLPSKDPGPSCDSQSRRKVTLLCPPNPDTISTLSEDLRDVHLAEASQPRLYTPSPPSTAPLPTKFHGKELVMNSIRSAPNLPHSKSALKELNLPVKALRGRSPTSSSGSLRTRGSIFEVEFHVPHGKRHAKDRVLEIKDRPIRKDLLLLKRTKDTKEMVLEFKGNNRRRHKYSSTESMTTSSSGGSMESIKSSTSEGNRSTSSSESRHSSSLSSHSSDSGRNTAFPIPQSTVYLTHASKLHILSPISDKSSQEPISETSDNNRNNNSQKCSPEEQVGTPENVKTKRRIPQNKNLLNLGFHGAEIQGSDSGISIHSREGIKSRLEHPDFSAQPDMTDLPFDMPKLRRRRMISQDACTSSSATSVDIRDLPFDMPKLRRRLRIQQPHAECSVSQASSSQSVVESDRQVLNFRSKLTLNLGLTGPRERAGLGLALSGLEAAKPERADGNDVIDVNAPLEKQGWFHGAITRVEAENVLRLLREGSFLVRNSESTKQDYSLSLKSAKGFMHMRIQRNSTTGSFILGEFSKPFTSIPVMIRHFSLNRLPIRGAEHMCLIQPVIAQFL